MLLHCHTALPDTDKPPEWVHLVPAGEFRGVDGRGPYELHDAAAVIAASLADGKIAIDENHSTDRALTQGGSAPAIGWVHEMQPRDTGIWGHVTWTRRGAALMSDRAYRGMSPAFTAPDGRRVGRVVRASVTNAPNLTLTHLHTETLVALDLPKIRRALGLPETASESDIQTAIERSAAQIHTHSQVAEAAGLSRDLAGDALITALRAKVAPLGEVAALQARLAELEVAGKRRDAEIAIDDAIRSGRAIGSDIREELIALHVQQPAMAAKIISGLPNLRGTGVGSSVITHAQQPAVSDADKAKVDQLLGAPPKAHAAAAS